MDIHDDRKAAATRVETEAFGISEQGKVRRANEDQFLVADVAEGLRICQASLDLESTSTVTDLRGHLLLVADGIGGHAGGKEASAVAVKSLTHYLTHTLPWFLGLDPGTDQDNRALKDLKAALRQSHDAVRAAGRGDPIREGMGTTLTLTYVTWPRLYLVHVGDSRCYLMRGDELRQLTRDHTLAAQLASRGDLNPEQAAATPLAHMLTRSIGGDGTESRADARRITLEEGDTLLLCTDGLNKHVSDPGIAERLRVNRSAEAACRALVGAALDAGGSDNVTVVVARFRRAGG